MNFQAIEAFLDLVKDPKKYEKMLSDLKDQHQTVLSAIELTAPAKEIPKLYEDAKKAVETAKTEADRIVKTASAEAEGIVAQATDIMAKAKVENDTATATTLETASLNKEVKKVLAEVKEKQRKLEIAEQAVAVQQEQLLASQAEVSEKLAKLQEVLK